MIKPRLAFQRFIFNVMDCLSRIKQARHPLNAQHKRYSNACVMAPSGWPVGSGHHFETNQTNKQNLPVFFRSFIADAMRFSSESPALGSLSARLSCCWMASGGSEDWQVIGGTTLLSSCNRPAERTSDGRLTSQVTPNALNFCLKRWPANEWGTERNEYHRSTLNPHTIPRWHF